MAAKCTLLSLKLLGNCGRTCYWNCIITSQCIHSFTSAKQASNDFWTLFWSYVLDLCPVFQWHWTALWIGVVFPDHCYQVEQVLSFWLDSRFLAFGQHACKIYLLKHGPVSYKSLLPCALLDADAIPEVARCTHSYSYTQVIPIDTHLKFSTQHLTFNILIVKGRVLPCCRAEHHFLATA